MIEALKIIAIVIGVVGLSFGALLALLIGFLTIVAALYYMPIQTFYDSETGYYVQLAVLTNMSTLLVTINVFKDHAPTEHTKFLGYDSVMEVSHLIDEPELYHHDGCYILYAKYSSDNYFTKKDEDIIWTDSQTGKTLCFRRVFVRPIARPEL